MNRCILFAIVFAAGACDQKASTPASTPAPGSAAPVPPSAVVTPPPIGPVRAVLTPTGALTPGTPGSFTLALEDAAGAPVTALDVVHEQRVHLIVVSPDLSFFDHVHPEARPDGTLGVALTLPRPDGYVAFADFKPTGAGQMVARAVVTVPGEPAAGAPLVATALPARGTFDGFEISHVARGRPVQGVDRAPPRRQAAAGQLRRRRARRAAHRGAARPRARWRGRPHALSALHFLTIGWGSSVRFSS